MHRVCSLRLGRNFVVRLAPDKNFYLRLTVEVNHKYLRPYGCSDINFKVKVKCTYPKTEIESEIIEIQIIGIQINFVMKEVFLLC